MKVEWPLLISARRVVMLYISTKFFLNYPEPYESYRADTITILKITKGNISAKMQVEWPLLISARTL